MSPGIENVEMSWNRLKVTLLNTSSPKMCPLHTQYHNVAAGAGPGTGAGAGAGILCY